MEWHSKLTLKGCPLPTRIDPFLEYTQGFSAMCNLSSYNPLYIQNVDLFHVFIIIWPLSLSVRLEVGATLYIYPPHLAFALVQTPTFESVMKIVQRSHFAGFWVNFLDVIIESENGNLALDLHVSPPHQHILNPTIFMGCFLKNHFLEIIWSCYHSWAVTIRHFNSENLTYNKVQECAIFFFVAGIDSLLATQGNAVFSVVFP